MLLLLSGCASIEQFIDSAGDANDRALIAAETTMCRAASVGSILRRYDSDEKAKAWKDLCTKDNKSVPIIIGINSNNN